MRNITTLSMILCICIFLVGCTSTTKQDTPGLIADTFDEPQSDLDKTDDEKEKEPQQKQPIIDFALTNTIHSYVQQDLGFTRVYHKSNYPFVGGSLIDIDGDGVQEIFITGEGGAKDVMYRYQDGVFVDIVAETKIDNTQDSFGSLAIDNDGDSDTDLLVARHQGIYYYENQNGIFRESKLDITFPADTVPVDISPGDIDNDGDIDLYISTFIDISKFKLVTFNDSNHKKPNLLLINQGDGTYKDETDQRGLTYAQNTFTAIFVDIDNNGRLDLVTSPNTDTIRIWTNNEGMFQEIESPTDYGFWMGMAAQDVDHDGDIDILSSNSGTSIAKRFLKGDTNTNQPIDPDFAYLLNNGDGILEQSLQQLNPNDIGFSRAVVNTDLDNDLQRDVLIAQNNIKRPPHKLNKLPGEIFSYQSPHQYTRIGKELGLTNKKFGFGILYGDVNGDDLQDIIYLNLDTPSVVALHQTADLIDTVVVKTPRDLSWYGKRIELSFADGTSYTEYILPKQGLMTSQSYDIIFPLGNYDTATVRVIDPYDNKTIYEKLIGDN